jgi:uncharacterized membrane protein
MMMFGWLILGGVIYYLYIKTQNTPKKSSKSALELLDYRYARGEMDEDTYLRMKENIEQEADW